MKLFVWDFHGVLEKGNDNAVVEITNLALEQHGHFRWLTQEESWLLSGIKWYEYISFLLPHLDLEECIDVQSTCFKISENHPEIIKKHIQVNEHADFVLSSIAKSEHHQILLSNTAPKFLDRFVEFVGLEKFFPSSNRYGIDLPEYRTLTKKHWFKEYIKDNNKYDSVISIGDSAGDMDIINEEIPLPGVSYLYSTPERNHRPARSHHKITDLRTVLKEI